MGNPRRARRSITLVVVLAVLAGCSSSAPDAASSTDLTTTDSATTRAEPRDRSTSTTGSEPTTTAEPEAQARAEAQAQAEARAQARAKAEATATTTTDAPSESVPTGVIDGSLRTTDGRDRTYRLFVPEGVTPGQATPLLVALHGGTGWGAIFATISGFDDLARREGFIVVYPDGVGVGDDGSSLRTWNAGNCCGPARNQGVDDVAFVHQLVDEIDRRYTVDDRRIYGVGHSNGGMLAYRLACEDPGRLAAVALQAGSLGIDSCAPDRPVSLLHLHGAADRHVPLEGGVGPDSLAGVDFRSVDASIAMVADALGCGTPVTTRSPTNPDVTTTTRPCDGRTEVMLMIVDGASHSWMGRPSPTRESYPDLDASAVTWEFLAAHPRP